MGSTIYTQKIPHPVQVSFTCEHCGTHNSFAQIIVGTGSAEVPFSSGKKYAQSKIAKVEPAAQKNLERKIQNARINTLKGNYSWLDQKKCSKCKYYQTWQTSSIWMTFIASLLLLALPVILISVWIDFNKMTTVGLIFFTVFIGIILLPFVNLIKSLSRIDRKNHNKPNVDI
jgi:hypothetical protein